MLEWFTLWVIYVTECIKADSKSTLLRSETRQWWKRTCCSVKDLGLKKDAGVLISNAGQEQSFSLDWPSWHNHLRKSNMSFFSIKISTEQTKIKNHESHLYDFGVNRFSYLFRPQNVKKNLAHGQWYKNRTKMEALGTILCTVNTTGFTCPTVLKLQGNHFNW